MSLTRAEVEHVARLARLQLTEEECDAFTLQLNDILKFVEQLNALDTGDIEPMAHAIPVANVFRPDQVCPSMDPELALANAPDRVNNYFRVPKVLEDGEA